MHQSHNKAVKATGLLAAHGGIGVQMRSRTACKIVQFSV